MAYPPYLRARARELRTTKHLSLDEIAERLALPKTTVWYWIKDLPLGRRRRASAGQRKGNQAMQKKWLLKRQAAYSQGIDEYDELIKLPTFRDFVVLYIAEGYKRSRNAVSLCNSDPGIVLLIAQWMRRLSAKRLRVQVQHHADQEQADLQAFWSELLQVRPNEVRCFRKSNSGQLRTRVWRCANGVATVAVYDTLLRARLQAWIDRMHQDWDLHSAQHASGRSEAWLSRGFWGAEIPGSNPGAPTSDDIARRFEAGATAA